MNLPKHLGGSLNKTHVDLGSLEYLVQTFSIKSMLDIGCGPGGMQSITKRFNIHWDGIDGDVSVIDPSSNILVHDFTCGPCILNKLKSSYELGWSIEFVEHVEERYMENYMQNFRLCERILLTHSTHFGGHHHVNVQNSDYWINKMDLYGFAYQPQTTQEIRKHSTMEKNFIRENGLFFARVPQ